MGNIILTLMQVALGASVFYVWIFRFHNVLKEFKLFGLNDVTRNFVGVSKVALSTLIVTSIWFPALALIPSIILGLFMIAAQYFHFKVSNPFIKHLPSLILLILCAIIAISSIQ